VDVGLLHLCLLGAGAGGVQEVAMSLHHTWRFQQAGDTQHCSQQGFLVLQTIGWVFGLNVFHQYLEKKKRKTVRKDCKSWGSLKKEKKNVMPIRYIR